MSNAANAIVNALRNAGQTPDANSELLYGTIVSVEPLSIKVDDRETFPADFLFLGEMVRDRITEGDRVVLLSFNQKQRYYVIEILTDDPNMCFGIYQADGGFIVDRVGYRPREYFWLGQMVRPHKVRIPHGHIYNGKTEENASPASHRHEYNGVTQPGGDPEHLHAISGQITEPVTETKHDHEIKNQVTEDVHANPANKNLGAEYVVLEIYEPLTPGDRCLLFSFNKGRMYYVAEKVGV